MQAAGGSVDDQKDALQRCTNLYVIQQLRDIHVRA